MRIVFLLPDIPHSPIGGFKIVYEYANRLVADGFQVTMVYPASSRHRLRRFVKTSITRKFKCRWFPLDSRVKEKYVWKLEQKYMPEADAYIATIIQTSMALNKFDIPAERKFYFIQGFENWRFSTEQVIESYKYPMHKITISKWLLEVIENCGEKADYIPNGFDFDFFRRSIEPDKRNPYRIAMLWHHSKLKGCEYGLEALKTVKEAYPQTEVTLFGVRQRPDEIPEWIEYYQTPDKETFNRIYNEAAIYLVPSLSEGFFLTIGEAMICGAAVVCTNIGGFREAAIPDETAIVVPVEDSRALANGVIRLFENNELRIKLAHAGHEHIKQFDWDSAFHKMKSLLEMANNVR